MSDHLYRACRGKIGHASPNAAALALAGHRETFGDHGVVVYQCPYCPCWHIGHPPRAESRRMRVQHLWDVIDAAVRSAAVPVPITPTIPPRVAPIVHRPVPAPREPFLSILRRRTQKTVDAVTHGTPRLMPRETAVQKITMLTGVAPCSCIVSRLTAVQCIDVLEFFEAARDGRRAWAVTERKLDHHSRGRSRKFRRARIDQARHDADEMEAA